jgi:hypothetical protein
MGPGAILTASSTSWHTTFSCHTKGLLVSDEPSQYPMSRLMTGFYDILQIFRGFASFGVGNVLQIDHISMKSSKSSQNTSQKFDFFAKTLGLLTNLTY